MRALVWTAPYAAELRELPEPSAGDGEAVLRVRATGVCGSDLHGYRGHSAVRTPPLVLGHEACLVDEAGAEYVVNPIVGCGTCATCRAGTPNLCATRGLLGLDRAGTFAERVAVRRDRLLALEGRMSPFVATLVEPLATPVHALRVGGPVAGAVVSVIGAGPIGLLSAYAAGAAGAALVTCHDVDPRRAEQARAVADATGTSAEQVRRQVREASEGRGADLVIDAVGVASTWADALALVRRGGTVAAVGLGAERGELPLAAVVREAVTVRGVYAYADEDFRAAFELLAAAPPPLEWIGTAPLDDGPRVLAQLSRGEGPTKVVLEP